MHKFLHVLEHGFIDSIKMLPIIILVYFLIEFLEYKQAMNVKNGSLLNKKHSPIFGALFGVMPQCGFSVVATDLYSKKKLNIGALIAVYISTSDEALPIMLSNFKSIKMLLPLVLIKIVVGIIVGYATQLIFDNVLYKEQKILLKQTISANKEQNVEKSSKHEVAKIELVEAEDHHHDGHEHLHHDHHKEENKLKQEEIHIGCCNHDIEHKKFDWKHPLLHSLKIILTILIINIAMGLIIEFGFKGEENLKEFLSKSSIFAIQPLLAMLIGLIPNCASSVVLTELYILGGLSFGSIMAGLIVNAGLGIILLFKQNKNIKENIFILTSLIITGLAVGYFIHFIF